MILFYPGSTRSRYHSVENSMMSSISWPTPRNSTGFRSWSAMVIMAPPLASVSSFVRTTQSNDVSFMNVSAWYTASWPIIASSTRTVRSGFATLFTKCRKANEDVAGQTKVEKSSDAKVSSFGVLAGFASGFFGIGGGFLIVPSILYSSNLNMNRAVGTSLLAVGTFGMVTAIRYGIAGQIIIPVAILYVVGGIFGGIAGTKISAGELAVFRV